MTFSGKLPDTYSLQVNPSLMYDFTMYLKLADGHEMVLWNGELDMTARTTTHSTAYSYNSELNIIRKYVSVGLRPSILEYMGLKCSMVDGSDHLALHKHSISILHNK